MSFAISILTYTAVAECKACIESVLHSGGDFDLILTANGSPEAAQYFNSVKAPFGRALVIENDSNLGFILPNERALRECDSEFFVMLNDDATVTPGWLEKFQAAFDEDPNLAIVGARGFQLNENFVGGWRGVPIDYVEGSCLAIRTALAKKHGLFDPALTWAYGEDADLCLRMRSLGYGIAVVPFPFKHKGATTTRTVSADERMPHFIRNHQYLASKWKTYLATRKLPTPSN